MSLFGRPLTNNSETAVSRHLMVYAWLCCLLLGLAGISSWLNLPLEGQVSGLRLSIWQSWFEMGFPVRHASTFGGLSVGVGLLLLAFSITPWRRHPLPWLIIGLLGLSVGILFLLRFASRMDDLTYVWDQSCQLQNAVNFATGPCEGFYGLMPQWGEYQILDLRPLNLTTRLVFNLDFVSWGVLLILLSGAAMVTVGLSLLPVERRGRWLGILCLALLLLIVAVGGRTVDRDRKLRRAYDTVSGKQYPESREILDDLGARNPDLWNLPLFLYLLGETHYHLGQESPAMHFYLGARLFDDRMIPAFPETGRLTRARFEWSQAAGTPGSRLGQIAHHYLGWALVTEGLKVYQSSNPGPALELWEEARRLSHRQVQASLYHAKAQMDLRVAPGALADLEIFLRNCHFRFLRGFALALRGDAQYLLGNYREARESYQQSLKVYHHLNFRALKGLSGA